MVSSVLLCVTKEYTGYELFFLLLILLNVLQVSQNRLLVDDQVY
jgi:hypothetical protein